MGRNELDKKPQFEDFNQLLDHLRSPVYVKDSGHAWAYVNPAFCALMGHSSEFLLGKTDFEIIPKEQADAFWEKDNEVFKTKLTNTNIETTTNAYGSTVWVESKKSYFENEQGDAYIFGVLNDITKLKEREMALEDSFKKVKLAEIAKAQFLANMSHEIRTPMNGVLGMAELLAGCDLPNKHREYVNIILRSGDALLNIINDILDFSNIETGQLALEEFPFVLRDCVESVMMTLAPRIETPGFDFLLRINPKLPLSYVGDVNRIKQVLTNIIGNAIKFTSVGQVYIHIDGFVEGSITHLTFSVEDTGIGIAKNNFDMIFDKFSQADNSTTREYGGTGLGLNIARDLVRMMGAERINVESELGKGTKFSFALGLPHHKNINRTHSASVSLQGAKILIVDDNETQRAILTEQITSWGCKCIAVESVDIGMQMLRTGLDNNLVFDMVITDYEMPNRDGEEFIRLMKADFRFKDIPSIMLSSVDTEELKIRMSILGVDNFLTKPVRNVSLLSAMSEILRLSDRMQNGSIKKVA